MKKHSTANILLVELVIVILFFMLCVSTLVEVFGTARIKSLAARAENAAMLKIENVESMLQAAADFEAGLQENGFEKAGEGWDLTESDYILHLAVEEEPAEAGILRKLNFTAEQANGTPLFELPTVKYIPGEVNP